LLLSFRTKFCLSGLGCGAWCCPLILARLRTGPRADFVCLAAINARLRRWVLLVLRNPNVTNTEKRAEDWAVVWSKGDVSPQFFLTHSSLPVLVFLRVLVYDFPVSWLLTVFLFFTTKSVVSCFWIKSQDLPFLVDPEGKCRHWGAYKIPVREVRTGWWRRAVFKRGVIDFSPMNFTVHWNSTIMKWSCIFYIYTQYNYYTSVIYISYIISCRTQSVNNSTQVKNNIQFCDRKIRLLKEKSHSLPCMGADPLVDHGPAPIFVEFQLLPRGFKPHHLGQQFPEQLDLWKRGGWRFIFTL